MKSSFKKSLGFRQMLAAGAAVLSMTVTALVPAPAYAQFGGIVYDPTNYSQNILTAARTLEQINNQIRQLQNQATSLINEARNLQSLPLTVLEPLQAQIRGTQQLLAQAQRISFDVQAIEREFGRQYKDVDLTGSQRTMVQGAEERWRNSVAAFEDALKVQAGAVSNIEGARAAVQSLVTASQSATGALQAAQAGNQLLALQAQQLADLTATVASLGRAQSLDAANAAAAKAQAREQLRRFLAPGRGYLPTTAQMFRN
jgi:type IV secretion system protein TrbJ